MSHNDSYFFPNNEDKLAKIANNPVTTQPIQLLPIERPNLDNPDDKMVQFALTVAASIRLNDFSNDERIGAQIQAISKISLHLLKMNSELKEAKKKFETESAIFEKEQIEFKTKSEKFEIEKNRQLERIGIENNCIKNKANELYEKFKNDMNGYIATHGGVNVGVNVVTGKDKKDKQCNTYVHFVCDKINIVCLDFLRHLIEENGADLNIQNEKKLTPLHVALLNFKPIGNLDLDENNHHNNDHNNDHKNDHKNDLNNNHNNYHNNNHSIPHKLQQKYLKINYLFSQTDPDISELFSFCCKNIDKIPLETFQFLISKGANVNTPDLVSQTPLHFAMSSFKLGTDINIMTYLLDQPDIKLNEKNQYGSTLFHHACRKVNTLPLQVFKRLVEAFKADMIVQEIHTHDTPLHIAFRDVNHRGIPIISYLLTQCKNVNINTKGYSGRTLLHHACKNIDFVPIDIFKTLIEFGGNVNNTDELGDSPLHMAFGNFSPGSTIEIVEYLASQKDAKLKAKNNNKKTCIDIAFSSLIHNKPKLHSISTALGKRIIDNDWLKLSYGTPADHLVELCRATYLNLELISYLVKNTTIDYRYKNISNPLHLIVSRETKLFGDSELAAVVNDMLSRGLGVNQLDPSGKSILDYVDEMLFPSTAQTIKRAGGLLGKDC